MNLVERGWGNPLDPHYQRDNIVTIVVGPFKAGEGKLTKAHRAVKLNVHKDLALIFQCFLTDVIRNHGIRLDKVADEWGYICRAVRQYEKQYNAALARYREHPTPANLAEVLRWMSNHGGGTAIDINSAENPMTKGAAKTTFPIKVMRDIAHAWGLEWGLDFKLRHDPMHFEWSGTRAKAKAETARLTAAFKKVA